jgi:hypothetical protein
MGDKWYSILGVFIMQVKIDDVGVEKICQARFFVANTKKDVNISFSCASCYVKRGAQKVCQKM